MLTCAAADIEQHCVLIQPTHLAHSLVHALGRGNVDLEEGVWRDEEAAIVDGLLEVPLAVQQLTRAARQLLVPRVTTEDTQNMVVDSTLSPTSSPNLVFTW